MTIHAVIHEAEEGGFWAEVPALPGCFTQGETEEEVRLGLREAVDGWFAAQQNLSSRLASPADNILALPV